MNNKNIFFIEQLILYCLHKLDKQRTIFSILHLFNGKKTSQTIQDAHLFQLTNLFGVFPSITRSDLESFIAKLERENLIDQIFEQKYQLTEAGNEHVKFFVNENLLPQYLDGWKFHHSANLFWERLTLAVQVISHLSYRDTKYIPIQRKREYHYWLKGYLSHTCLNRDELSKRLFLEIVHCFEANQDLNPSILVSRLTGFQRIGLTAEQSARLHNMDLYLYDIQFQNILHYMISFLNERKSEFPLLFLLIADLVASAPLTESTRKTYSLLKKQYQIEEIAQIRGLKKSTIEDHIVELALNVMEFDISPFISEELRKLIAAAFENIKSKQLKQIRKLVPEADYFQIRLVLAQAGEKI
ncbi:helix-turn-helix domain-containing protein [Bacillus sp. Bva_UNVM-123]|uniref:helix-turn-helix domain-containing protein n=1 Tax=Bacillus sp. Bva_UNVM-123 TaxID=2829798 RepID=UPI00391F623E